jgi:hypothetical protein
MLLRQLMFVCVVALVVVPGAFARGGNYAFDGGTKAEQAQVRAALNASSFDWGLVPGTVTIHIAAGVASHATAGQIWLDANLLDAGRFSWGVVQHEYAHQIDFGLLDDATRTQLHVVLGGTSWWGAEHSQVDCERFADAVAWSYWQSPDNVMRPQSSTDEGGQVTPARFRTVLGSLLQPLRAPAAVKGKPHPRKG